MEFGNGVQVALLCADFFRSSSVVPSVAPGEYKAMRRIRGLFYFTDVNLP